MNRIDGHQIREGCPLPLRICLGECMGHQCDQHERQQYSKSTCIRNTAAFHRTPLARHMRTRRAGSNAREVWAKATVDLTAVWYRLREPAEYRFIQCVCQDDLTRHLRCNPIKTWKRETTRLSCARCDEETRAVRAFPVSGSTGLRQRDCQPPRVGNNLRRVEHPTTTCVMSAAVTDATERVEYIFHRRGATSNCF